MDLARAGAKRRMRRRAGFSGGLVSMPDGWFGSES